MPTASLTLSAARSIPEDNTYRVTFSITNFAEFSDGAVFLIRQSDNKFDRVASLYDLGTYPITSTSGVEFYRQATAIADYSNMPSALKAIEEIQDCIDLLVKDYAKFRGEFDTTSVFVASEAF